jgi:hypothetical protein
MSGTPKYPSEPLHFVQRPRRWAKAAIQHRFLARGTPGFMFNLEMMPGFVAELL